jgi:hypothetical protein
VKGSEFFYMLVNRVLPVEAMSAGVLTAAQGVKSSALVLAPVPVGWDGHYFEQKHNSGFVAHGGMCAAFCEN